MCCDKVNTNFRQGLENTSESGCLTIEEDNYQSGSLNPFKYAYVI